VEAVRPKGGSSGVGGRSDGMPDAGARRMAGESGGLDGKLTKLGIQSFKMKY